MCYINTTQTVIMNEKKHNYANMSKNEYIRDKLIILLIKKRQQKDNNEKHNENNACIINICFNS